MNAIRTPAAKSSPDATLYRFEFDLEWKGRTGIAAIISTGIDDAETFWRDNAKAFGFPKSAYVRNRYLGKETPEDRVQRAELTPIAAHLVDVARGLA